MKNIAPTGSRLLIEIDAAPKTTKAGIFLPDSHDDRKGHRKGTIRAMGPEVNANKTEAAVYVDKPGEMKFKEGERVIIGNYGGHDLDIGDQTFALVEASEVLARFND